MQLHDLERNKFTIFKPFEVMVVRQRLKHRLSKGNHIKQYEMVITPTVLRPFSPLAETVR